VLNVSCVRYTANSPEGLKAGTFLAGGFCGTLVQLGGDLDYLAKWLGFPRWSNHTKPCGICLATYRGQNSWLDNRNTAGWLTSGLTCAHWTTVCPLFEVPGVSGLSLAPDYMHNMFLGWLQYFYGSVLFLLVFHMMTGNPLDSLKEIAKFIKQHQKDIQTKYVYRPRLDKLSMFVKKTGYPRLRGRAADIMGLYNTMLELWKTHMTEANLQHRQIRLILILNKQNADCLEEYHPRQGFMAVPEARSAELLGWGLSMAQLHSQLLEHFKSEGIKVFNMTTKTHFAFHSLQLSVYIHPALVWCFKGETTMHNVQIMWKSCLPGTKHFGVSVKAAYKYRHLMHMRNAAL
jgi:hypothetical protein